MNFSDFFLLKTSVYDVILYNWTSIHYFSVKTLIFRPNSQVFSPLIKSVTMWCGNKCGWVRGDN